MKTIPFESKSAPMASEPPIKDPYVLFVCVPVEIDEQGRRWTIELWAKDLALHLDYLEDLTLAGPVMKPTRADLVSLNGPPFDRLKFVDLPFPTSKSEFLRTFPRAIRQYWNAIGRARIVHVGFGGWPLIQAWLAIPLAKLRGRFVVANLESSPWRVTDPTLPWYKRLYGRLGEYLTRYCLSISDIRLFTSKSYLEELLPPHTPRAYVMPATWLNEEWIIEEAEAEAAWEAKQGPIRLLFAGRLFVWKGIAVLLAAIEKALDSGVTLQVSIIGTGPMLKECIEFAESEAGGDSVNILDPVPYGEPFLSLLRGFDAVVVPSLSDEQPRILFDAFSQAVPIIGTETGGLLEVVQPEVSGRLVPPSDVDALAQALIWCSHNRAELRAMGLRGLETVRDSTHQAMHEKRHTILLKHRRRSVGSR